MTTASTGQFPRVRLSLTRSATERRCTSGRRMARYEPFPSSPLKFRTAGFPQSGFKAGLSDSAFPIFIAVKPHTRHTLDRYWFASTLRAFRRTLRLPLCVGSYSALHAHRHEHGCLCRVTPGVLAQVGVVVFPPSLLNRPHGPHLRAQRNFSVIALYALPCLLRVCALAARK
jgi:hypothetical protein